MDFRVFVRMLGVTGLTAVGFWMLYLIWFGSHPWYLNVTFGLVSIMAFQALFGRVAIWYHGVLKDPFRRHELKYLMIVGVPALIYDEVWNLTMGPILFLEPVRGVEELIKTARYLLFALREGSFKMARQRLSTRSRPELTLTFRLQRLKNRTWCAVGWRGALCRYRVALAKAICRYWVDSRDPGHCL